ncbi:hypothetical protein ABH942_001635 [Flavobacterium sp. 28YEA47A]|uniref:DUF7689 domain-containing protein n=1 Tax=Flavobacterium sp. 28YEA47A TaxID=3156276 RepID=UPI0035124668
MELRTPIFPNTYKIEPFRITSPATQAYNCIAWAFGDDTKWYWPTPNNMYYWPKNIPAVEEADSFIRLYSLIGYQVCDTPQFEEGIEKITIFLKNNIPTHAARQLADGTWTSKLGSSNDVSHILESMNGGVYGDALIFMSRPRT